MTVEFIPSNVHQGHYIEINGEFTGMVVNLYAYQTINEYRNQVDEKIENYIENETFSKSFRIINKKT